MILSSYEKFSNAIQDNESLKAEEIFAFSDIRCELISYGMKFNKTINILNIIQAFSSKGLREQALTICNNCSQKKCKIKMKLNNDILRYSNDENRLKNIQQREIPIEEERIFDIKSGKYFYKKNN